MHPQAKKSDGEYKLEIRLIIPPVDLSPQFPNIHRDNTITFNRNIIMFQFLQKPFSNILFTNYTTKI